MYNTYNITMYNVISCFDHETYNKYFGYIFWFKVIKKP